MVTGKGTKFGASEEKSVSRDMYTTIIGTTIIHPIIRMYRYVAILLPVTRGDP